MDDSNCPSSTQLLPHGEPWSAQVLLGATSFPLAFAEGVRDGLSPTITRERGDLVRVEVSADRSTP